jgi:alkylation response protein AidB-like acyl-CoA dehydrogenase
MQATSTTEAAEQTQMLRESAADFVRGSTDMKKLRERRGTLPGYEPGLLRQMAELGWLGILVAEDHGGLGLGFAEMAVVLEELGKGLLGEPLASTVLAARLLQHGANEDLKARLLPGLVDASALQCVAWQEGLGGLDVDKTQTTARQDGESLVLDGAKRFVAGAAGAAGRAWACPGWMRRPREWRCAMNGAPTKRLPVCWS